MHRPPSELRYTSGKYAADFPGWHAEHSSWKAQHILACVKGAGLDPRSVAEIGCGAGEILRLVGEGLPKVERLRGYDIAADAIAHCQSRRDPPRLDFVHGDLLEGNEVFDLLLAIDVLEHVEDYLGFVRQLREHARRCVFHIPLDLSVANLLRDGPSMTRTKSGHLHYFTRETALATLRDAGHRVLSEEFTAGGLEVGMTWKRRLMRPLRRTLSALDTATAARLLGGFSLLVLTETDSNFR